MDDQQDRLMDLFNEACAKGSAEERDAYLSAACGSDADLRRQVETLLHAHEQVGDFLQPTVVVAEHKVIGERPGTVIGRYKLLQKIGEGGFGVVYMAEQVEPVQRKVALKIIKAGMDSKEVIARFEAERQALALMDHPGIANILDGGATEAGRPYFVMELVNGIPITDYCDWKKLPTAERLQLFMKVCHAVQHAHQKGIIHRDLKPSNVLVTLHDGEPVPKVIDFGVVKALGQKLTQKTLFTGFQHLVGTPAYMSPEQAELSGLDIDTRSDIYSLGVLLYELLTGMTPFDKETLAKAAFDEMRRMIRETEPPKPSTRLNTLSQDALGAVAAKRQAEPAKLNRLVRGDLDWIVMKCLEKDRKRRYETANNVAVDLEHHLKHEPVSAAAPSPVYVAQKFIRRHKAGLAMAGALVLLLAGGVVVSTWQAVRATRAESKEKLQRARAESERNRAEQQRAVAEVNEKKAMTEAARSAQVAQFMKNMLKGVGPSVALGRDITMLREILDQTAGRIGKDLNEQPDVESDMRSTIGQVYFALARYTDAEAMHREALRLRRKLPGNDSLDLAQSLYDLGLALAKQGRAEEAITVHSEALAIRRKLLGNEHPDMARSLSRLGQALSTNRKFDEAERTLREAVTMQRKLNEHLDLAESLTILANTLNWMRKTNEAETAAREAVAIGRTLGGNECPEVAGALQVLGNVLLGQSRASEAEAPYREALEMRRKLLGIEHPLVGQSVGNLAACLKQEGKLAELISVCRKLADQGNAEAQRRLGTMYADGTGVAKDRVQALKWYRKAAEYGDAQALNVLAWFLATCDDPAIRDGTAAVGFAEKAVAGANRTNPNIMDTLAAAYAEAGQFTNAIRVQQEAIALLQNEQQKKVYASRLKLYESGIPYRNALLLAQQSAALHVPIVARNLAAVLEKRGKSEKAKLVSREARTTEALIRAKNILPRNPQLSPNLIDLSPHYNASLDEPLHTKANPRNNLSALPRGLQTLADVQFDLRGVVQLSSSRLKDLDPDADYPERVNGIKVARHCRRLHFLHASGIAVADSVQIGSYIVHYADGQQREIPIVYGENVRDWWGASNEAKAPEQLQVAWTGRNGATPRIRLFKTTWENPLPDLEVRTIDYVSKMTLAAPFLVALTVE